MPCRCSSPLHDSLSVKPLALIDGRDPLLPSALKSDKCTHGIHGLRSAAAGLSRLGFGHPELRRFRVGLEFAVSGHKDLDKMIEHHSKMARFLGEQIGLTEAALDALDASYESGTARAGPGSSERRGPHRRSPGRDRRAYGSCAYVGGIEAAEELVRKQSGQLFDPTRQPSFW